MNKNKGNQASLRGGNNKRKAQKHQNKVGFKPQFNDILINRQKNTPLDHLCHRCMDQIQWKLQYCKYKVIKDPHTCTKCSQKTIIKSYRHCCDLCADKYKICAKCLQEKTIKAWSKPEGQGVENALLKKMQEYLKTVRERSRRKIMRLIKQKEVTFNNEKNRFEYIESGKQIEDLQFKALHDDLDDDFDLDDDEDMENEEDMEELDEDDDFIGEEDLENMGLKQEEQQQEEQKQDQEEQQQQQQQQKPKKEVSLKEQLKRLQGGKKKGALNLPTNINQLVEQQLKQQETKK